ncbi:hypothetical protein [Parabacteroides bouchesdurhonensis]|uniref:hypothetical protein n=1 Tax=Parabacteroides bouchesdurhonensis TaxID=1936995 RepID=UPI000E47A328|nr:hypothetical protein [Parabacteroides bouchesdurhonensis]RHJ93577.1 hypothetical protein DW095_05540 [Bacteroides sp. AM07-16]
MGEKKRKKIWRFWGIILLLVAGLFVLNFFLTKRLEKFLKEELAVRTSDATDGFYRLSFQNLSISFFKGELKIEGIRLYPDSVAFCYRKEKDSLPSIYVDAQIGMIDFKGVDLTWRRNFRRLNFKSFEIKKPDIKMFGPDDSSTAEKKLGQVESKTLYEVISPYIDVLSVQALNLENASVSYETIDSQPPISYALKNVSFHAYGFRLDKNSSESGKLLYCDNFDFVANHPQTLLKTNDFMLETDRIVLNTKDSVICISNIEMKPLNSLRREEGRLPHSSLNAFVKAVEVRGVAFHRKDALNYLTANSFQIVSPDINIYNFANKGKRTEQKYIPLNADSIVHSLSLYEIISPVLHSVSIRTIGISEAKAQYSYALKDSVEVYKLANFNFRANDFLIDSLSELKHGFWYPGSFSFEASGIEGLMTARNYHVNIEKMAFCSETESLKIEQMFLRPLSSNTPSAYNIRVSLKALMVDHIIKDSTMLRLRTINVDSPVIDLSLSHSACQTKPVSFKRSDLYKSLGNIAEKIVLERFNVSDATLNYAFRGRGDSFHHQRLNTANLIVKGLLVDNRKCTFKLDDIRFSTNNLSFPLDNGYYTLHIGDINLADSALNMEHLHLAALYPKMKFAYLQPHHKDWFDVKIDSVSLLGINFSRYFEDNILRIKDVQVKNAVLQNFKNQKIAVPRHVIPMIYSGLQKAPVNLDIQKVEVKNLSVVYEELAKKGTVPGKLFFTDMNGVFSGFTNIISKPDQYIRLDANGKLMGRGYFTAIWLLPVDSLNDRFLLNAHMTNFDLTALNELIEPLAFAEIKSGYLNEMTFSTEATSKGATIDMIFLYTDLRAALLKEKNGELVDKRFLSDLVNLVLKHDNPDKKKRKHNKPRLANVSIIRDPYHSTFNYLWQILRPALMESVGVPLLHDNKKSAKEKLPEVEDADVM